MFMMLIFPKTLWYKIQLKHYTNTYITLENSKIALDIMKISRHFWTQFTLKHVCDLDKTCCCL